MTISYFCGNIFKWREQNNSRGTFPQNTPYKAPADIVNYYYSTLQY